MSKHMDKSLSPKERAEALLTVMTVDEKIAQLRCLYIQDVMNDKGDFIKKDLIGADGLGGFAFERVVMTLSIRQEVDLVNEILFYFKENTRLGIPPFIHAEALHGLCLRKATSFPQAIGLAAMWDVDLMGEIADCIADECRVRGITQVLSPTVDIAGDLRWGRIEETYGEDPLLISKTAVAFCEAFEHKGIVTTPKHFIANSGDGGRDSGPVFASERLLKKLYLRPYEACIKEAGSSAIMASYNCVDSIPVGFNKFLLQNVLRDYLGFNGFVVTDYSLMRNAKKQHRISDDYAVLSSLGVKAGLNRELPSKLVAENGYQGLKPAFERGLIDEKDLDRLVFDVLYIKFIKGMFDRPLTVDYEDTKKVLCCDKHRRLAYEAAVKSIVLLKNDNILPLRKDERIALLGTITEQPRLGGYSSWGIEVSSIREAMCMADYINLSYGNDDECEVIESRFFSSLLPDKIVEGLQGYYKNDMNFCGPIKIAKNDGNIDFNNFDDIQQKLENINGITGFSVEWHGFIESPQSGRYSIQIKANGGVSLKIDEETLIDRLDDTVMDSQTACFYLEAWKKYPIKVGFRSSGSDPKIKLCWNYKKDEILKDINYRSLLKDYETVVIAAGVSEGEGKDRANLNLPDSMEKLITDVADAGKKTIVVIYAGGAVTMEKWSDKAAAVMHVWYPGQAGGKAIADLLYGNQTPSGRLPITFPRHVAQLPINYNSEPRGRNSGYADITNAPLFSFGFGLSYTSFDYFGISLEKDIISPDESTFLHVHVKNTGHFDGDEVVQLYIKDVLSSVATPVIELKDFKRIHLKKGELQRVTFSITKKHLELLNQNLEWVVEPGDFELMVGSSCENIHQKISLHVK